MFTPAEDALQRVLPVELDIGVVVPVLDADYMQSPPVRQQPSRDAKMSP